jgi:hypothetical protein
MFIFHHCLWGRAFHQRKVRHWYRRISDFCADQAVGVPDEKIQILAVAMNKKRRPDILDGVF